MSQNRKQRRANKLKASSRLSQDQANQLQQILYLHQAGEVMAAQEKYIQLLQQSPENPDILHLLGVTYYQTGEFKQSVALIGKAIEINPDNHSYFNNIGNSLLSLEKKEEAVSYYKKALALKPGYADAINNCGAALGELGRLKEEILIYKTGLNFNPDDIVLLCNIIKAMQEACLWKGLDLYIQKLLDKTRNSLSLGQETKISPYLSLCLPFSLPEQKQIAQRYSMQFPQQISTFSGLQKDQGKIRIGYVSADFRDHPTAHLIAGMLKNHDRNKFEVFAYSIGKDDNSIFRNKIQQASDHFIDLVDMDDVMAAQIIKADGIDILMDVMGHIQNARPGIFAEKPAPVQINYLAYPGTMGADFIDYIIMDKMVIKAEEEEYFSEKIIYMPDTYFATNPEQEIAKAKSRSEYGLPDDVFVFCCFNKTSKIDVKVFDSWVKILKAVPNSVLWLYSNNEFTMQNLRAMAKRRDLDLSRLIFAQRLPKDEHLARHVHADLFLDCFEVCAHTTAIDSLFAGVPVITKYGHNIISRASSSILSAISMPELITYSVEDYEKVAIEYATDNVKFQTLKQQLAYNIKKEALFNAKLYTKNLEESLEKVAKIAEVCN